MVFALRKAAAGGSGVKARVLIALLAAGAAPAMAQAQTAPAAPPTREELNVGTPPATDVMAMPRVIVEGDIERGPCPLADPASAGTRVTFSGVEFRNLDAVPPATLDETWREYAGREVPIATLCDVRDRAATMLRRQGYLAAVQIPPQRIETGGVVRMDVLIARLTEVQVRGDVGASGGLIAAHVAKLTRDRYFNINQAERHLLLLGDLPGYDVRLALRPANGAPGDVVGDIVVERTPIEAIAGIQNLGSRGTGREGVLAQVLLNGLTGLGDQTLLSIYNTLDWKEQTVLQVGHEFALGSDGLRLGGKFLYGRGRPGLSNGRFRTETKIANLELSYPLIRSQTRNLAIAGGLDVIDQKVDFASIPLTRDKLRVLYARLSGDEIDARSLQGYGGYSGAEPLWRAGGSVEVRKGLSGLGASNDCRPLSDCLSPNVPISNFLADPSGLLVRAEASVEYRPVPAVTIAVSPRVQYSDDSLLSFEQYSLGNYTVGRGFDPGATIGDSGAGASFELRYGKLFGRDRRALALQPFAFLDAGWTWTNRSVADDPRKLYSAGGGVRARWNDRVDGNLVLAVPLNRSPLQDKRGDVRILFNLRARLLP